MPSIELSTLSRPLKATTSPPRAASFVDLQPSPRTSVDEQWQPRLSASSQERIVVPEDEQQWMKGAKLFLLLSMLTLAMLMVLLDTSIIATAIPHITDEFHSLEDVGLYASIYQLANAALQPLAGRIYHRFSNKVAFLVFLVAFEIGSAICGTATTSAMLVAGRAIAGARSAGIISGGLTIAASAMRLATRVSAMGAMLGIAQVGIAIGPLLGGAFTTYTNWRWCFYINLPVGLVLAIGLFFIQVPDQSNKPTTRTLLPRLHRELDLLGFVLISGASTQLLLALSWGGVKHAWGSVSVVGLLTGAAVTALLWLLWNWSQEDDALIPLSLLRVRAVWAGSLTHWFLMVSVFCASYFLPVYFQAVHGASPMMSGVYMLASIVSQLCVVPVTGKLVERTGHIIPFAVAAAVIGCISNGLYSTLSPTTPAAQWIGYQILNGVGRGIGMPLAIVAVQAAINHADVAMGNSIVVFTQSLGTAVVLALSNMVFLEELRREIPIYAPAVDPTAVIAAGATRFRAIVPEQDLPGVLMAYSRAIGHIYYPIITISGMAIFTSLYLGGRVLSSHAQRIPSRV
ncbi:major facilitator superfamily domain-containing protein [Staphylotrichum tortipilum]|uniref:Major facilitator superfamily domain-containing protein n=1 Tax=Staphylotrichum tortipilum TaxID=2831512 RepID=A0AAN6MN62_9PEZI|nr:major facilitator superfamily domain-containing protein [Staphylotrichum longicolle]